MTHPAAQGAYPWPWSTIPIREFGLWENGENGENSFQTAPLLRQGIAAQKTHSAATILYA